MGDITNSENPAEMQHDAAFHQGLHCLLRLQQNATDIKNILALTPKRAKWNTYCIGISIGIQSVNKSNSITVKPVLSGHSKRRPKIGYEDRLLLNSGKKYCRMLQESILQHFRLSLSYHFSLKPLFCPFLSGRFRQVSLYIYSQT